MITSATILVVDDDRTIRMLMRAVLEAVGATVLEASSAHQADRLLRLHGDNVDALVTDLAMPGQRGDVFASQLRRRSWDRPIIVCTGEHDDPATARLLASGDVDGLVGKPFVPSVLVRQVEQALIARSQHHPRVHVA